MATFLHRPVNRGSEVSIPTGLCRSAQGCGKGVTLGVRIGRIPNPSGLQQTDGNRCNPVGVGEFFRRDPRVARPSQPWDECWNPVGIRGNTLPRFIVATVFAALLCAVLPLHAQIVADGATNTSNNVPNTFPGDVTVGTNGSFTLLVLSDNSLLTNSGSGIIGLNATATSNEVRLVSPSARWQVGGSLFIVGSNGAFNRLVVSNGATVKDAVGFVGENVSASNNLAVVTGPGSVWSNASSFFLGFFGAGNELVVSNGG